MAILCWLTMIKPLITILVVVRYRQVVKQWFFVCKQRICGENKVEPVASIETVTAANSSSVVDAEAGEFY
jgi:hypothetical protein